MTLNISIQKKVLEPPSKPEVSISSDSATLTFKEGSWNRLLKDIEVFDSYFVNRNIHSGFTVDSNHTKNLPDIILGEDGLTIVEEIEKLKKRRAGNNSGSR